MDPAHMDDQQLETAREDIERHSFATAEARWAYERARRLRFVCRTIAALIFLGFFGWGMFRLGSRGQSTPQNLAHPHDLHPDPPAIEAVGAEDAAVQIVAILPEDSDCHTGIAAYLSKTAAAHPQHLRVEFKNMESFTEEQLTSTVGMVCAAVLINGRANWDVLWDDAERRVSLIGTVPTHYTLGDLALAINQAYNDAYGIPPEPVAEIPTGHEPSCLTQGAGDDPNTPPEGVPIKPDELILPSFGNGRNQP